MPKEIRTPQVSQTEHRAFVGLIPNGDPHDLPTGAFQVLTNAHCLIPGQVTVRRGIQPSTDFTPASPTTNDIINLYGYTRPEGNVVLIQDNAGNLKAFRATASTTLASSLAVDKPGCFAKHRRGHAIFVTGRERGYLWNGTSSAAYELGVDYPASAPSVAGASGGAATAGDYDCVYRYVDADRPDGKPSSISSITTVTVTANQKFSWTGLVQSTQTRVTAVGGRMELWRTTYGETNIYYLIKSIGHNGAIASSANNGGTVRYTTTLAHGLVVGAVITIASHSVGGYNGSSIAVTAVPSSTTFDVGTVFSSTGTGGTWVLTGYNADTASDATLQATGYSDASTREVLVSGTEIGLRRHTVPPNYKRVAVQFQDRMLFAVDDVYTTGTIETTAGGTTVTGTGTAWTSAMAGRYLYCKEIPEPLIISSASATSITTTVPISTTVSGKTYGIRPRPDVRNAVIYSELDEPESVPTESDGTIINIVTVQENTGDDDEMTGMIPFGAVCYVAKERHMYTLTFFDQPKITAAVGLLSQRGLVNQRCWAFHEAQCFVLDRQGPYIMSVGGEVKDIAERLRNRFRDTTIDWSKQDTFFVGVDPIHEKVYFCVCYTGDTGSRPRRAMVYCIRSQTWSDDLYFSDLGGFAYLPISNTVRLLSGGLDDVVWIFNQGTTDGVTSQYLASITSASSSTTLTASGATFTSAMRGCPVYVYEGTGKGTGSLTTNSTSTTLTIESALTVDTTSRIMVGGIPVTMRLGIHEIAPLELQNQRGVEVVYLPTSGDCTLDIRRYWNHDTVAENNVTNEDGRGGNITWAVDSPNQVLNLKSARVADTKAAGWGRALFSGHWNDQMEGKRWFAPEILWVAGDYSPILYSINVIGAENGSD